MGKKWKLWQTLFSWAPKSMWIVTSATKLKDTCSLEEKLCKHQWHIKKQRHHFADKGPCSQTLVFPVVMYGYESWTIKKDKLWRTDAFELWYWRTLESPLDCKEIQPVNPKGNQTWIFIGRIDAKAETPIFLATWCKEPTHGKDPDAEKDWRQTENGGSRGGDG